MTEVQKLRDSGLTWNQIAEKLHPELTGEQLRKRTKRLTKREEGRVVRKWQVQTKEGIQWLESRDMTQDALTIEDIRSIFGGIVLPKEVRTRRAEPTVLNLYLADIHIGAKTDVDLLNRANQVKDFMSNTKCSQVNVIVLGDTIDGWNSQTTRGGHTLEQNLNNKEQFQLFQEFFIKLSNFSTEQGMNMDFIFITNSNHGGDFEWLCASTFEMYINSTNPKVNVHVSSDVYVPCVINDHMFVFTHGKDEAYMKRNLPLTLTDTIELRLLSYLPDDYKSYKEVIFVKGDLHRSATNYGNQITYRNITTFNENTNWAKYNFGDTCRSGFEYDIIGNNRSQGVIRFK